MIILYRREEIFSVKKKTRNARYTFHITRRNDIFNINDQTLEYKRSRIRNVSIIYNISILSVFVTPAMPCKRDYKKRKERHKISANYVKLLFVKDKKLF